MNLTTHWVPALLKGAAAGLLAIALAGPLRALIAHVGKSRRALAWTCLLVPYLIPVALVGYAYSNFSLSLVHHPLWNEVLYEVLVLVRLTPLAALVVHFAPGGLGREAVHCWKLLGRASVRERLSFVVHGRARSRLVGTLVVFLFAFCEFEMASLMSVRTWTVSVFDAQAEGLPLSQSLGLALGPMLLEAALLLAVMVMLFAPTRRGDAASDSPVAPGRTVRSFAWSYLVISVFIAAVVPIAIVLGGTVAALVVLTENPWLVGNIVTSVLFASAAAAVAYLVAGWFVPTRRESHAAGRGGRLLAGFLSSLPGLLGGLVLALLVQRLFQFPLLRSAYDTPLPLLVALVLLILPFAVLLRVLMGVRSPGESLHAARMLGASSASRTQRHARELVWEMKTRGQFLVIALLCSQVYFEVVATLLLAPSGMTPVFRTLYNMMHYGQISGLSAMVLVAFAVPFALLGAVLLTRRFFVRLRADG